MINAESLAKSIMVNSAERKKQATNINRLIGGLRNFKHNDYQLEAKELNAISDAIAVLEKAVQVAKKAEQIKLKEEKHMLSKLEAAKKAVDLSPFAKIDSIADKIALMACQKPHLIQWLIDDSKNQFVGFKIAYDECIKDLPNSIAYIDAPFNEQLDGAWIKFQAKLPSMKQQHAALILHLQELQAQAIVKP